MRAVAASLSIALLEERLAIAPAGQHHSLTRGLLFGVAGFLPISPTDASFAGFEATEVTSLEASWEEAGSAWRGALLSPTAWTRVRVRPPNHPAARLAAAAALVVKA
jgi:hypothetical protein